MHNVIIVLAWHLPHVPKHRTCMNLKNGTRARLLVYLRSIFDLTQNIPHDQFSA